MRLEWPTLNVLLRRVQGRCEASGGVAAEEQVVEADRPARHAANAAASLRGRQLRRPGRPPASR